MRDDTYFAIRAPYIQRIAELERELEAKELQITALCKHAEEHSEIIVELERKLAEQQAIVANFFKMYSKDVSEAGFEELNNLLAKAKEDEREACALLFEGQYTDSCPQTNISETIRRRT